MVQRIRERVYSIDAKLYLCDEEDFTFLLNELESILDEEAASFGTMPEGLQESGRGLESRAGKWPWIGIQECPGLSAEGGKGPQRSDG